jgi:hypothetical protein
MDCDFLIAFKEIIDETKNWVDAIDDYDYEWSENQLSFK